MNLSVKQEYARSSRAPGAMKEPIKPESFNTTAPKPPSKPSETLSFVLHRPNPWDGTTIGAG